MTTIYAPWKAADRLDDTIKRMKLTTASTTKMFEGKEPTDEERLALTTLAAQSEVYAKGLLDELGAAAKTDMRKYRSIKQALRIQATYRETLLAILAK